MLSKHNIAKCKEHVGEIEHNERFDLCECERNVSATALEGHVASVT